MATSTDTTVIIVMAPIVVLGCAFLAWFTYYMLRQTSFKRKPAVRRGRTLIKNKTIVKRWIAPTFSRLLPQVHAFHGEVAKALHALQHDRFRVAAALNIVRRNRERALRKLFVLAITAEEAVLYKINEPEEKAIKKRLRKVQTRKQRRISSWTTKLKQQKQPLTASQNSEDGRGFVDAANGADDLDTNLEIYAEVSSSQCALIIQEARALMDSYHEALQLALADPESADKRFREIGNSVNKIVVEQLPKPCADRLTMDLEEPTIKRINHKVKQHISFKDSFLTDMEIQESHSHKSLLHRLIRPTFRNHPYFYGTFFFGYAAILLSFFVSIGAKGEFLRFTWLSVPPYYSRNELVLHAVITPLIYGVMHGALYCLGWLPIPFLRGFLRDLAWRFPGIRKIIPVDDMVSFHRLVATLMILSIVVGAVIYYVVMSITCSIDAISSNSTTAQALACGALNPVIVDATTAANNELFFDSIPGASYVDPRDNVLFLREIVFILWFFFMPLVQFARSRPPRFLPTIMQTYWWEICYYVHLIGAIASVILAEYARFEVFYCVLPSWGLYFIDRARDKFFHTHKVNIIVDSAIGMESTQCNQSSTDGRPWLLNLRISKPKNWLPGAGQWIYLNVPGISRVFWHPFSLASAAHDELVHLHIGLHGPWREDPALGWVQDKKKKTWTYDLYNQFLESAGKAVATQNKQVIKAHIRGPYGSPFTKCFDPRYPAVVVIGGGTGLTSALSVLKEIIYRRIYPEENDSNKFVWFVWTCKRVDDLLWCWKTLEELLIEAYRTSAINISKDWRALTSNMLDWIGVTIYVTQPVDSLFSVLDVHNSSVQGMYDKSAKSMYRRTSATIYEDDTNVLRRQTASNLNDLMGTMDDRAVLGSGDDGDDGGDLDGEVDPGYTRIKEFSSRFFAPAEASGNDRDAWGNKRVKTTRAKGRRVRISDLQSTIIEEDEAENDAALADSIHGHDYDYGTNLSVSDSDDSSDDDDDDDGPSQANGGRVGETKFAGKRNKAKAEEGDNDEKDEEEDDDDDGTVPIWMVGRMSRAEAESVLLRDGKGKPGDFIVRLPDAEFVTTLVLSVISRETRRRAYTVRGRSVRQKKNSVDQEKPKVLHLTLTASLGKNGGAFCINGVMPCKKCKSIKALIAHLASTQNATVSVKLNLNSHALSHLDEKFAAERQGRPSGILDAAYDSDGEGNADTAGETPNNASSPSQGRAVGRTVSSASRSAAFGRPRNVVNDDLLNFLDNAGVQGEPDIHTWLKQQILEAPVDHKLAHIKRLLAWVRGFVADPDNGVPNGESVSVPVCFCGPPGLSHLIHDAAEALGGSVQFSSEHQ